MADAIAFELRKHIQYGKICWNRNEFDLYHVRDVNLNIRNRDILMTRLFLELPCLRIERGSVERPPRYTPRIDPFNDDNVNEVE